MNVIFLKSIAAYLFNDDYGQFNWLGITSVVAILGLVFNAWDSRRKFKADLISKNKLQWMNTIRPLIAQYIARISKYMYLYHLYYVEEQSDLKNELDGKMEEIRRLYYELRLYIPANLDDKNISRNIDLIWHELDNIGSYNEHGVHGGYLTKAKLRRPESNYSKVVDKYLNDLFIKTVSDANTFFTKEWDNVKQGK